MGIVDGDTVISGLGLPEGPRYSAGYLYVADASAGGVWRVPSAGGTPETVVAHRRGIAGLALHASGGFVVGGRNLAWKRDSGTVVLATVDIDDPLARFNDLTTSPSGQVYVGSICYDFVRQTSPRSGSLVLIDLDGSVREVAGDVQQSNGLAFSPDGHVLYHVDSGLRLLRGYAVNPDGSLGQGWEVYRWSDGIPDGMAAATDGTLWVALADVGEHGYVSVVKPTGSEVERFEMPHPAVRSLCFGGRDGREVFVALSGDSAAARRDGFVMRFPVEVSGIPDVPARIMPPADAVPVAQ